MKDRWLRGSRLLAKVARSLARDKDLPLAQKIRKGMRYVAAMAAAQRHLRVCNRVGARPRTLGRPLIRNRGRIVIGDDFNLNSSFAGSELITGPDGLIEIGNAVHIQFGSAVTAHRHVKIGDRVHIGPYSVIADTETADAALGDTTLAPQPIAVGDDVWLAGRVTVLPGATIGGGSIIAAGAVVSGAIPPHVIAGGIPARVLRSTRPGDDGSRAGGDRMGATPPELQSPGCADGKAPGAARSLPTPTPQIPLSGVAPNLHGVIISDFTIDELAQQLRRDGHLPVLDSRVTPFGQVMQALLQPGPSHRDDQEGFAVVWTRPEAVIPSFQALASFKKVDLKDILDEVDSFCSALVTGCKAFPFALVPTWVIPSYDRGLGLLDMKQGLGIANTLMHMNLRLVENLDQVSNVHVLNAQKWIEAVGKEAFHPRLWYMGKIPFHSEVFAEATKDIKAALAGLTGHARKLVILDLDDTLWGGVVGDVGWQNLRLGGHDSLGEAFVDFQSHLKSLTRRGIVLGIASKNEESVALEAIKNHPEMVLKLEDFVGWKISWKDKVQNIVDLVSELNLGLQSVVFIDHDPVERARVQETLPEVFVPEWPDDKLLYSKALLSLRCFDSPSISKEDPQRTKLDASQGRRVDLTREVGSLDHWLKSLETRVRVEEVDETNLPRATQLFNKTNQMNLSTRRMTESELMSWAQRPNHKLWTFSVQDRFGDAGLTGVTSMMVQGRAGQIVDFILSGRVMGRKVEETMVHVAVAYARKLGLDQVTARFTPTTKNKPCFDFWKSSGFQYDEGKQLFSWQAHAHYPLPECIEVEVAREVDLAR